MPQTIPNVQLAKTGTIYPHGVDGPFEMTVELLQAMVDADASMPNFVTPISRGHWPADGEPAYGRVENKRLEADGDTTYLMGDLIDVDDELATETRDGKYPGRSIGFLENVQIDGTEYRAVMIHLAFLGADQPAVPNMEPLFVSFRDVEGAEATAASRAIAAARYITTPAVTTSTPPATSFAFPGGSGTIRSPITLTGASPAAPSKQDSKMTQTDEMLRDLLGLPADASAEDVEAAYAARETESETTEETDNGDETRAASSAELETLRAENARLQGENTDLSTRVTALETAATDTVAEGAIAAALNGKRTTDAGVEKLRGIYAAHGLEALNAAIDVLPTGLPEGELGTSATRRISASSNADEVDFGSFVLPADAPVMKAIFAGRADGRPISLADRARMATNAVRKAHPELSMTAIRQMRDKYLKAQEA